MPPPAGAYGLARRATFDTDSQNIVEDCSGEELKTGGMANRLPVNVGNVCTFFYFGKRASRLARAFYVTRKGDTIKQVVSELGLREEMTKTYVRYVTPKFIQEATCPGEKNLEFKKHKVKLKEGVRFPAPNDSRWRDMRKAFQARQKKLHPPWKTARLMKEAMEEEVGIMRLKQRLDITRKDRHGFWARKAMAKIPFTDRGKRAREQVGGSTSMRLKNWQRLLRKQRLRCRK